MASHPLLIYKPLMFYASSIKIFTSCIVYLVVGLTCLLTFCV